MASPFDSLLSPDPALQAAALEQLMRQRRQSLGQIGMLSGHRTIAPMGKQILGDLDQEQQQAQAQQAFQVKSAMEAQRAAQEAAFRQRQLEQGDQRIALGRAELGLKRDALNKPPKPAAPPNPDDLRKELQGQQTYRDFQTVSTAYKKIQSTSDTGPGDMSLIFGYMKLLDPGSTVREGEYATAQNAGSVPENIVARYNQIIKGEKLAPEVRKQFRDEATRVFQAQKQQFDQIAAPYVDLAKKRGIDPREVVFGYEEPAAAPQAAPQGAVRRFTRGPDGKLVEVK